MKNSCEFDFNTCIQRISVKDMDAVEMLYREMKEPVYRYALTLLQDHGLAEDAMQITFLKIMANADSYRQGVTGKAWVMAITRNTCHDLRQKKTPIAEDEIINSVRDECVIDALTDSIAVKEAFRKLTSTEREIMSLYIFSGLRQTEIAQVLRIPYLKVRSHYGYAVKKLRKELGVNEK